MIEGFVDEEMVHRALGPGHLESPYEEAMDVEMALRGMRFRRQVGVVLMYKGREVGKAGWISWWRSASCLN
jgi:GxxExxY protein